MRLAVIIQWGVVFAAMTVLATRVYSHLQILTLCAMLGISLVGFLAPESVFPHITSLMPAPLTGLIANLFGQFFSGAGTYLAEITHFVVFMVLGVIMGINAHQSGPVFSLAILSAFASLTEVLQLLVVGRMSSVSDIIVNLCAGTIGLCIGIGIFFMTRAKPRRQRRLFRVH